MALTIDDPETEHLAEKLAQLTGDDLATAIKRAIENACVGLAPEPGC
jgi:antitoxin VapB